MVTRLRLILNHFLAYSSLVLFGIVLLIIADAYFNILFFIDVSGSTFYWMMFSSIVLSIISFVYTYVMYVNNKYDGALFVFRIGSIGFLGTVVCLIVFPIIIIITDTINNALWM